jgi:hypothetical protein
MSYDFVSHLQELDASATGKVAAVTEPVRAPVAPAAAPTQKTAAEFVEAVDARMQKIATVIASDRDEEHAQLFKNCVSACFHYKMAGYTITTREEVDEAGETVKVAFDFASDPSEFMAMCFNMYRDILNNRA